MMTKQKTLRWMFLAGACFLTTGCAEELQEPNEGSTSTSGTIAGEEDPGKGKEIEELPVLKEEN